MRMVRIIARLYVKCRGVLSRMKQYGLLYSSQEEIPNGVNRSRMKNDRDERQDHDHGLQTQSTRIVTVWSLPQTLSDWKHVSA